jgi:hypothetical protein
MNKLRIIVLGYIVRGPLGGLAWHHLQYVMGLARLGHDVYFLEDSDDYPACYDPEKYVTDIDPTYGLHFATEVFAKVGLKDLWAYYDAHTSQWLGPCSGQMRNICLSADLLLNISNVNPLRSWTENIPRRALIDTDPVFTQIGNLEDPEKRKQTLQHTSFFSFGENIRGRRCSIPDDGFSWQPTRQPVVLDAWKVTQGPEKGKFTTIMQWESYPAKIFNGQNYGMKSLSFKPYMCLPEKMGSIFELAMGSSSAPREEMRNRGWLFKDPLGITRDPWTYQSYLQASKAEFSVAKQGYVVSRSGWFSERSANYLATGRPVVVQETGFSDWLESGSGVVSFNSLDEAVDAIHEVEANYNRHSKAACAISEEYFDSDKILSKLIEEAMSEKECRQNFKNQDQIINK